MKTSSIIAALALTLAGGAFAQEATYELPQPATSLKTRAEVRAELDQARRDGSLRANENESPVQERFVATRSRDEVRAETLAAIARGELLALNRESSASELHLAPTQRAVAPTLTAAVR